MLNHQMEYAADLVHPTSKAVELYALGSVRKRLDMESPEVGRMEEHLLWCAPCLEAVEREEAVARQLIAQLKSFGSRSKERPAPKVLHAGQASSY